MAVVRVLQAVKRASLAFHRWFMKYSGMTMIIDNVEERRRWRQSTDRQEEDHGSGCERDYPSQKREMEASILTGVDDSSSHGSAGAVSGSTEGNKKVLG